MTDITDEDMSVLTPLLEQLNNDFFAKTGKRLYARFDWTEDVGPNHPNEPMSAEILLEKADLRIEHKVVEY